MVLCLTLYQCLPSHSSSCRICSRGMACAMSQLQHVQSVKYHYKSTCVTYAIKLPQVLDCMEAQLYSLWCCNLSIEQVDK